MKIITKQDLQIAEIYFILLIKFAANHKKVTFDELSNLSKLKFGKKRQYQKALSLPTTRPLEIISEYCHLKTIPDITLLVMSNTPDSKAEVGRDFNTQAIYEFTWAIALNDFNYYIESQKVTLNGSTKSDGRRQKETAMQLMNDFYRSHKTLLPIDIHKHQEQILEQLIAGKAVADAYQEMME